MSDLLIRTEAPAPDQFVDDWRPRSAQSPPDDGDDAPFMPLILAIESELARLLGVEVSVHPGRSLAPGAPDVALELGALLAAVRLGGDPARPLAAVTGVTTARHARFLADQLLPLVQRLWPAGRRRPAIVVDVLATVAPGVSVVGSVRLAAPPDPMPAQPPAALGAAAFDLPLRMPVRIAHEDVPLHRLLPLQPGLVISINTCAHMQVMLGDTQIAIASVVPLPDGRQQASLIAIDLKPLGDRA